MFLAKLKSKSFKVVFSDANDISELNFYRAPEDLTRLRNFDPEQGLEADEWYYVDLDTEQQNSMMGPYYESAESSGDQNRVSRQDYNEVDVVFLIRDNEILFTKITGKYRIENKRFLNFSGTPKMDKEEHAIEFTGLVDTYYDGNGRLYFRNFSKIRTLFAGIEDFFKEATREDKEKFANYSLFDSNGLDIGRIGMRASRRIAAILADESINLDDEETQEKIRQYATRYPECGVETNTSGKLVVNTTKSLDGVLNLLSGRYYTSEITGDKMEARATSRLASSQ